MTETIEQTVSMANSALCDNHQAVDPTAIPRGAQTTNTRLLYSSRRQGKPGPKEPSTELIWVIVEMKKRNPRYSCPRIAEQIAKIFGVEIDKNVVLRVLAKYYHPL